MSRDSDCSSNVEDNVVQPSDGRLDDALMAELKAANRAAAEADSSNSAEFRLERYEVIREVRRGGQGIVYESIQLATGRRVALKLLLKGIYSTDEQRRRFEREVDLLAGLSHPNVVTLFDSGSIGDQLFYAMEFIEGEPLHACFDLQRSFDVDSRIDHDHVKNTLHFFDQLCDGVAYCQRRGLIHRDIKPGNVLVRDGAPVIVDFGLAKSLDLFNGQVAAATGTGEFVGTLAYASPEQTQGDSVHVDMRTDVYSLGVILYELLTGQLPSAISGSPVDVLRRICDEIPVRPSLLNKAVDRDLEIITMKALSKEPERRYQSADDLRRDVRRRVEGLPIDARSDSTWYVISTRLKRHKGPVALAMLFLLLLTTSSGVMYWLWETAVHERCNASFETHISSLYAARSAINNHQTLDALDMLRRSDEELRGWEWNYLLSRVDDSIETHSVSDPGDLVACWAVSQDRSRFAVVGLRGTLRVISTANGDVEVTADDAPIAVAVEFDRSLNRIHLLTAEGELHTFDCQTGKWGDVWFVADTACSALLVHPDANRIYVATGDRGAWNGRLLIYDSITKEQVSSRSVGATASNLTLHPKGDIFVAASDTVQIRDAITGKLIRKLHHSVSEDRGGGDADSMTELAFSDDGKLLVAGTRTGRGFIWEIDNLNVATQAASFRGNAVQIEGVAISPDGTLVATASLDGLVRTWESKTGKSVKTFHGHVGWARGLTFSEAGDRIWGLGTRASFKVFVPDADTGDRRLPVHSTSIMDVKFSPDGKLVATTSSDHSIRLTRVDSGIQHRLLEGHTDTVHGAAFVDENTLASASADGTVRLWKIDSGEDVVFCEHENALRCIATSVDGRWVAAGAENGIVKVWELRTRNVVAQLHHADTVWDVGFTDASDRLVSSSATEIMVTDLTSGQTAGSFKVNNSKYYSTMAMAPGGQSIARGDSSGRIELLGIADGLHLGGWGWHEIGVSAVAFDPTGERMVSAGPDGTLKVWDVKRQAQLLPLTVPASFVHSLDWSPDGRRIAAGLYNGTVVLYEAIPPAERLVR